MRLPISGLILIMVAGVCFVMFLLFDYALHSGSGVQPIMWNLANETLGAEELGQWNRMMTTIPDGFRLASVACLLSAIAVFVIDAFSNPRQEM